VVGRLAEDVGQLVQLVPGQEAEGELVRPALVRRIRVCASSRSRAWARSSW